MSRAVTILREATPEDASDLVDLWSAGADDDTAKRDVASPLLEPRVMEAASAVARIASDPGERLLVAVCDQKMVGALHLRRGPISPIQTIEMIHLSHLMVLPGHRRKGVASTLVAAATSWAQEKDSPQIVAVAPTGSRDVNRFLARLGFSNVGVVRVAPVSGLRARFAGRAVGSRDTGRLIAARRNLRRHHRIQTLP